MKLPVASVLLHEVHAVVILVTERYECYGYRQLSTFEGTTITIAVRRRHDMEKYVNRQAIIT